MKAWITLFAILIGLSGLAVAATPRNDGALDISEIFRLPMPNALKVLRKQTQMIPELERLSFDPAQTMDRRWRAFGLVIQAKQTEALPLIDRALKAPEWYMRNLGLLGLEEVAPQRLTSVAMKMLSDRALVVRSAAVSVLQKQVGRTEVREALWKEIEEKRNFRKGASLWIRGQIAELLAEDPVRGERDGFLKILKESDRRMHIAAFTALEKITGQKVGKTADSHQKKLQLWRQWASQEKTTKIR